MNIIDLSVPGVPNDDGVTYDADHPPETRSARLICEGTCPGVGKRPAITPHRWERDRKTWDRSFDAVGARRRADRVRHQEFICAGCGTVRVWGIE